MTTLAALREARRRLTPPGAWCQEAFGRNIAGATVSPRDEACVQRCLGGALMAAGVTESDGRADRLARALGFADGVEGMERWNDEPGRTHTEVLARLDRAIEREAA